VIIVSGPIGDHGMAILSVREGLEFETAIESDTAPLNGLVEGMLAAAKGIHCLRDLTRGGLAAALNELASSSNVGVELEESSVPVRPAVRAACEMLGFDPLYVANEGKLVCFLPEAESESALSAMRAQPLGAEACRIGVVVADHPGRVVARTSIGGSRLVDLPAGELLPRIC
jgi:hydrogenase expression/formation protein HypE